MPSPFVCRSFQSISGFREGTLRHVNSIYFPLPVSFFLRLMSTFCPFLASFVSQNCVCYQSRTTCMRNPTRTGDFSAQSHRLYHCASPLHRGYLKGQGVLISATLSLGNKVIMCMYLQVEPPVIVRIRWTALCSFQP